ncbi:type III secretion protein [Pseudomonas sp. HN11]|uniref:type III secretion protein n=1 Tax=Pseudomonas sp. HN11 TaxID=1344094 RepID=UPI001F3D454D|nr:type III secretion protein [Pseudomonas sp. HN11]UII73405.1 type III secretion protein [Pseudomonas sp. HN11]
MTSTSLQPPSSGCQILFCKHHETDHPSADRGAIVQHPLAPSFAHAAETRRMKAFTGQSKFQAPVADDFSRGLAEPSGSSSDDDKVLRRAGVINGLTAWLRRQTLS